MAPAGEYPEEPWVGEGVVHPPGGGRAAVWVQSRLDRHTLSLRRGTLSLQESPSSSARIANSLVPGGTLGREAAFPRPCELDQCPRVLRGQFSQYGPLTFPALSFQNIQSDPLAREVQGQSLLCRDAPPRKGTCTLPSGTARGETRAPSALLMPVPRLGDCIINSGPRSPLDTPPRSQEG